MSKAKYQDNLEFIQWLKRYYDLNCGEKGKNYQPEERRGGTVPDFSFAEKVVIPKTYNGAGQIILKKGKGQLKKSEDQVMTLPHVIKKSTIKMLSNSPSKKQAHSLSMNKPLGQSESSIVLKHKLKFIDDKLIMIKQIASSSKSAQAKVKMILQVLNA